MQVYDNSFYESMYGEQFVSVSCFSLLFELQYHCQYKLTLKSISMSLASDPLSLLKQIGLTQQESDVFLLLLELGASPVSTIALRGRMKRTNLYNILGKLAQSGLVTEFLKGRVRYFQATEPQKLLYLQEQQKKKLEHNIVSLREMLPLFESMKNPSLSKPKVKFYQGKEGIETLLSEILAKESFDAYFNPDIAYDVFPYSVEQFLVEGDKKKLHIRELIVSGKSAKTYVSHIKNPNHQWKILPKEYQFETDNFIFGNSVVFISYREEQIAVMIESSDIARTQRAAFELMWMAVK